MWFSYTTSGILDSEGHLSNERKTVALITQYFYIADGSKNFTVEIQTNIRRSESVFATMMWSIAWIVNCTYCDSKMAFLYCASTNYCEKVVHYFYSSCRFVTACPCNGFCSAFSEEENFSDSPRSRKKLFYGKIGKCLIEQSWVAEKRRQKVWKFDRERCLSKTLRAHVCLFSDRSRQVHPTAICHHVIIIYSSLIVFVYQICLRSIWLTVQSYQDHFVPTT